MNSLEVTKVWGYYHIPSGEHYDLRMEVFCMCNWPYYLCHFQWTPRRKYIDKHEIDMSPSRALTPTYELISVHWTKSTWEPAVSSVLNKWLHSPVISFGSNPLANPRRHIFIESIKFLSILGCSVQFGGIYCELKLNILIAQHAHHDQQEIS